jgi:hypothetical protein
MNKKIITIAAAIVAIVVAALAFTLSNSSANASIAPEPVTVIPTSTVTEEPRCDSHLCESTKELSAVDRGIMLLGLKETIKKDLPKFEKSCKTGINFEDNKPLDAEKWSLCEVMWELEMIKY